MISNPLLARFRFPASAPCSDPPRRRASCRCPAAAEGGEDEDSGADGSASHYSGYRDLSDEQVRQLAEAVVKQVRKRGPFLNLSEFLNRRLSTDPEPAICGALQAVIDSSGLNDAAAGGGVPGTGSPGGATMAFPEASALNTAAGNPGWLMQGDILDPLGPVLVARGDTFRIRGYGETRDVQGKVLARAWCEAVVQRVPDYIDATESAETALPGRPLNTTFGRRYATISFRWLSGPDEWPPATSCSPLPFTPCGFAT